jgi:PKD repeat protein
MRFAGAFSDPGRGDTHVIVWGFGDGATADTPAPVHRYREAGTYRVSLTVRDDDGGEGTDSLTVTISDEPYCANAFVETFDAYGK